MTVSVDKASNMLRTQATGSQAQSVIQLEYQSGVLTIKEMRDMSQYVKEKLATKYFLEMTERLQKQENANEYGIQFWGLIKRIYR